MPSELKSETARINGAKSHGPKTPEGKEISSRNAVTHGMTARDTFILATESREEYQEFLAEHIAIHQPVTEPEKELVDQMAIARWRIRRFVAAETVLFDCEIIRNQAAVNKEFAPADTGIHLAMAIRKLADESHVLSLMSRYESRHQRVHDKAYAALRELQKSRTSQPAPVPVPVPVPAPANSPSVSAGAPAPVENKKIQNEPTAPPSSSPHIHLLHLPGAPEAGNPEDHEG